MNTPSFFSGRLGLTGLALVVTPVAGLFKALSDPDYLIDLAIAFGPHHSDPNHAIAKLAASLIAILGGVILAYLGRPLNVPKPASSDPLPPSTLALPEGSTP